MSFAVHPSEPQTLFQCKTKWSPHHDAVIRAAAHTTWDFEGRQPIDLLTTCFSRHQISEQEHVQVSVLPDTMRPSQWSPSLDEFPEADSPALSPLTPMPLDSASQAYQARRRAQSSSWNFPTTHRLNTRALREQRLQHARLMTDDKHQRQIATLVERMVNERSQCFVHQTASLTSSPTNSSASTPLSEPATLPLSDCTSLSLSPCHTDDEGLLDDEDGVDMSLGVRRSITLDSFEKGSRFRRTRDSAVMPVGIVKKEIRVRNRGRYSADALSRKNRSRKI